MKTSEHVAVIGITLTCHEERNVYVCQNKVDLNVFVEVCCNN